MRSIKCDLEKLGLNPIQSVARMGRGSSTI